MTGRAVLLELKHFCALTSLTLSCHNGLDETGLVAIGEAFGSRLRSLTLACKSGFTGDDVGLLCLQCVSLTYLDLSGCRRITDASIIAVSDSLPSLSTLDLSNSQDLNWAGVCEALTGAAEPVAKAPEAVSM